MEKNNKRVSIIVPVYKVEKYLDDCVRSLVAQSYKDLQIILVDDGSPDSCGAMCDNWALMDNRITVIHKENGGLSDARNAGVKCANGEYIYFVDSDDRLESNAIESAVCSIRENNADIVISTHKTNGNNGQTEVLSSEKMFQQIFYRYCWEAWGKLYKTELIADMLFPKGKIYEDIAYTPYAVLRAKKVVYMDDGVYHYTIRNDSIMGRSKTVIKTDLVENIEALLEHIKVNNRNQVNFFLNWSILFLYQKYLSISDYNENKSFVIAVNTYYRKHKMNVWLINNYGFRTRWRLLKTYFHMERIC